MTEPILQVKHLRKAFERDGAKVEAVRDVSFEIYPGECLGLIGESGSGKSTVANLIAGLEAADGGQIQFRGTDLLCGEARRRARDLRAGMQMVFQNPQLSFNPAMTIGQGLEEAVRYRPRLPKAERTRRARALLRQVGLPETYADRRAGQLSGGECQRAAIARALMPEPELLLCDEITSALDVSVQAQVVEVLMNARRERPGTALLFISHDIALVSMICDRILVMHDGEIVDGGAADAVLNHSTEPYTRRLISSVLSADAETMGRYAREGAERG